jgi:HEAT repeat protein
MKNLDLKGAPAIALGIARDEEVGPLLLRSLREHRAVEYRGHLAVALGLTGHRAATETLRRLLAGSSRRPELRREAAVGLGLLGDCDTVPAMVRMLRTARSTYVMASITQALGVVGDHRAVKPLVEVASAPRTRSVTRAFACVALGTVGENEPLPPLSRVFADHNYLATTSLLMSLWDIL